METVSGGVNWHYDNAFLPVQRAALQWEEGIRAMFCLPSPTQVRIFEASNGGITGSMLTAKQIQEFFKLQPLPIEGGYFFQSYRSKSRLAQPSLPACYAGERGLATAIYYMLTPDTFSAMHRLKGDEIYHFYLGDPVEMLMLKPDGAAEAVLLGQDILAGMRVQHTVAGGTWQGSRLAPGGKYALMGTTMAPGFDPADYEQGNRDALSAQYPNYAPLIAFLTR